MIAVKSNMLSVRCDWYGDCLSLTPSATEALLDKQSASAKFSAPLRVRKGFPAVGDVAIASSIVGLRSNVSPSTVFFDVSDAWINTIKAHGIRTFAHVFKECRKAFNPSVANGYANSAVVAIACVFWVAASFLHAFPNAVRSRVATAMRGISFREHGGHDLFMETPARFAGPARKAKAYYIPLGSAGTLTRPSNASATMVVGSGNYSPASKRHACKVFEFAHFRHLEKFTIQKVWQAVVKPLFGSYPSHDFNYNRSSSCLS